MKKSALLLLVLILWVSLLTCRATPNNRSYEEFHKVISINISETNQSFNKVFYELKHCIQNKLDSGNKISDMTRLNALRDSLFTRIDSSLKIVIAIEEFDNSIPLKSEALRYLNVMKSTMDSNLIQILKYFENGFEDSKRDSVGIMAINIFKVALEATNNYDVLTKKFETKFNLKPFFENFDYEKQNNTIKKLEEN